MPLTAQPKDKQTEASNWLEKALDSIVNARVTVLGDYCLDAYWTVEPNESELSIETSLPVRRVSAQRYSPGGAGNVVANLKALGVAEVRSVGLLGEDIFGTELIRLLKNSGIRTDGLLQTGDSWQTPLYAKPLWNGQELNRFDFGVVNRLSDSQAARLLAALNEAVLHSDAVVINQQLAASYLTPVVIAGINEIIARHPNVLFLIDSRNYAEAFTGAVLKLNAHEAARLTGKNHPLNRVIYRDEARADALAISIKTGRPVFVTRGAQGMIIANGGQVREVPGIQVIGKTDPVGAGDTVVAALAAMLGCSDDVEMAASLANLAASITVRKLHTTGTATPTELREINPNADYVYEPELAESPRLARFLPDSEIEVIREKPATTIRHAIFDHDGTLSTLRQGWEKIMEPMMLQAILGDSLKTIPADIFHRIETDVRAFIDNTTGIQTLAQMKGLIGLIREYGYIPESQILDEHGYKAIYNRELLKMVNLRVQKIQRGELEPGDFEIKGARQFLEKLHAAGVKLYLASGTDETDVQAEATVMGYAHLFSGGIHGAVGDLKVETKRVVVERIIDGGDIRFIEMPDILQGKYQYLTQADAAKLRQSGYAKLFPSLEEGVRDYVQSHLDATKASQFNARGRPAKVLTP